MAQFEATVRLFELMEADAAAARRIVEERLHSAGFSRWQVVHVRLEAARMPAVPAPRRRPADPTYVGRGLLIAAAVSSLLWFLWLLGG